VHRLRRVLGPALALGSSLTYGVSDFLGGTTSRRIGTLQFIFFTQLIGALLAVGWVVISSEPVPPVVAVVAATGAGLGLAVGVGAFFQAMVVGKMSVVAPISATGVVLPVAVGIARGERPSAAQAVGIVVAIAGVALAARPPGERQAARAESGFGLALVAAVGTGLFLWLMAPASRHGVAWAILISRVIPAVALIVVVGVRRTSLRPAFQPRMAGTIVVAALLAFAGTALYALATLHSQLVIVSVLGSLYPAVTGLLAYHVLGERLGRSQLVGIAAVLSGVVLLST
jgi:drug/metabolite transporter (DMT)-like permease